MAKQIQMTKGDDVIKCSEDHIDHFGYLNYREIDVLEDLPNLNKNNA